MSSDLLGVSVTGLRVSQAALSTTGHNISNAGVEGYSRQRVITETNPATLQGAGYIGNGASVQSVERVVNEFLTAQLRVDTSLYSGLDIYHSNVSQLDNLLSDVDTGLSSAMESFFSAMQNGVDDPTSIPARQLIVSEAENLEDRFNTLYERFSAIENGINKSLSSSVAQVNALVKDLAEINRKVADAMGAGNNAMPNDLLDQRDETLRNLAELISIQVYDQGGGQVNVVVGRGQNLVIGSEARFLSLASSAADAEKQDVIFSDVSGNQVLTNLISGGEIGGLLKFRDQMMDTTYNEFGRIAVAVAETINQVHHQGITLNDTFGRDFFYDVNEVQIARDRVVGNSDNLPPNDRVLRLNIVDSSQLTASDYNVEIEGGGLYKIERLSDGEQVASGLLPATYPFTAEFDGLALVFESGSFQSNDEFKLRPTKSGGRDFTSLIKEPELIAFGVPLSTEASLGNQGSGAISAGEVLSLTDVNGVALPLLANAGQLEPPLVVRFTSKTTYDVLDNSDPGHPVQLSPPIRNQRFIPGIDNPVFSTDPGETQVSMLGPMTGIPAGRGGVTQAALSISPPAAVAPSFGVSDFSGTANQFSFDLVVSNTISGSSDGVFQVAISGPAILDNNALLNEINTQLSSSDARAYIDDNGNLAFRLNDSGTGDITLQNYNGDPDGNGDSSPLGQANSLLGFDVENVTFTTVGNVDGVSGSGFLTNGYPAEVISITRAPDSPGAVAQKQNIYTNLNASAKEIASALNNVAGVTANAFTYVELSNFRVTGTSPLQIVVNGEPLLEYSIDAVTGNPILASDVPDPQLQPDAFSDYLAAAINTNTVFSAAGIHAQAATDPVTGFYELRIVSSQGDDIQIDLTANNGESIDLGDGENPNFVLSGAGSGTQRSLIVGGRMDVKLAEGVSLGSFPPESMLFGNTASTNFSQSTFLGIQLSVSGEPEDGDDFSIDFNVNGAWDNRNGLKLVNLQKAGTLSNGTANYSESYGSLVEAVGIDTSAAKINVDASERVLDQSIQMRDSISAVNLDEEAANLIRFEQMYSANAQVISVARDLFNTLIGAF